VDEGFFIPSHDFMAEFSHNFKHEVTGGGHAFGEVYPRRKKRDMEVHLPAEAKDARKSTFCCHISKQELGVELPHLILNRDEQSRFEACVHALA
jgi:hypothetical protein